MNQTLIVLFLRGGFDGLNFIGPSDDPDYINARGNELRVLPGARKKGIRLKKAYPGFDFRMHHSTGALGELYEGGALAFIHASGLTHGTRSHFEAQDLIERGTRNDKKIRRGWLTRFTEGRETTNYAVGDQLPASCLGSPNTLILNKMEDLKIYVDADIKKTLRRLYTGDGPVRIAGKNALDAVGLVESRAGNLSDLPYKTRVKYPGEWPGNEIGGRLKTVAQLLKLGLGPSVVTIDYGGWDMHDGQSWAFGIRIQGFSDALGAFYEDVKDERETFTMIIQSEFGRRLKGNSNEGTDHGYGNVMMLLGGRVKGGKMYGSWPGLSTKALDKGVDLAITTDYRDVLAEVLVKTGGVKNLAKVLPGFTRGRKLGLL